MKIKAKQIQNLTISLGAILAIVLFVNILQISSLSQGILLAKEQAKPAKIQLVTILNPGCGDCFDITTVVDSIKRENVNVTGEKTLEFSSEAAGKLIEKYDLEKIPAVLVSGEIDELSKSSFNQKENVLVFEEVSPPYTETKTGEVKGLVSVIYLKEASCEECPDLEELMQFEQAGIKIVKEEKVEVSSGKGQELIRKYNIDKVPTILFSEDIALYDKVNQVWDEIGSVEEDGTYILRLIRAPYFDVQIRKVVGLVDLTMITDNLCEECYDVKLHKQLLAGLGLAIKEEKTVDINSVEGVKLRMKYKLKKVPTIILSGDMEVYDGLEQVWQQVGTIEDDDTYVFRELDVLQVPYKDLTTNKITGLTVSK